jgi:hypothetical protein
MSAIRITVGAQADASLTRVFAPLLASAAQAKARVMSDMAAMGAAQARSAQAGAAAQEREMRRTATAAARAYQSIEAMSAKAASKEAADAQRASQAKVAATKREFDTRLRAAQKARADETRAAERSARDIARIAAQAERESIRMAAREQARKDRDARNAVRVDQRMHTERVRASVRAQREQEQNRRRQDRAFDHVQGIRNRYDSGEQKSRVARIGAVARGSMDNLKTVGREAVNMGKAGFQAAGVQFDPATLMQRAIDLESSVTSTTISAMTGKGKVANASDISSTMAAVKQAGHASKQDYGSIATGLSDFVSKSGDLDTGKKALSELGLIARATGADVGDLVSAAGDVAKTLDDTPDKAERLLAIMRLVAKQGAMGSVEIKDLAKYMGNVTASAFMFEGGLDNNIGILGGLAQTAMKGGAVTAAEGTRAANSFARDITKESALKRFEGAGIDVFADKERTKLLSPEKIITQFLEKTGGSLDDLASLFQNEMSKKVIKGYSQIYDEAGGGDAGIAAVKAQFAKMSKGMTSKEVRAAANVSMSGKAAQAQEFQNKLEDLGMELASRMLPALMKLTPTILAAADALARIVGWAAENPMKAAGVAVGGSILKSMAGNAMGGFAMNAATALAGGAATGVGGAAVRGVASAAAALTTALGPLGAALLAGAVAVGAFAVAFNQWEELKKGWNDDAASDMWKKFKNDIGVTTDEEYQAELGMRTTPAEMAPPPTVGQPAGAPPTVTAPPPNPIPKLDEVVSTGKAQVAATEKVVTALNSLSATGPSVNSAGRTGPAKK